MPAGAAANFAPRAAQPRNRKPRNDGGTPERDPAQIVELDQGTEHCSQQEYPHEVLKDHEGGEGRQILRGTEPLRATRTGQGGKETANNHEDEEGVDDLRNEVDEDERPSQTLGLPAHLRDLSKLWLQDGKRSHRGSDRRDQRRDRDIDRLVYGRSGRHCAQLDLRRATCVMG